MKQNASLTRANLAKRVKRARQIANYAQILQRDKAGRVRTVILPGHHARRYQVILTRSGHGILTKCELDLAGRGLDACPGNSSKKQPAICYHSIAAVILAAADRGRLVAIAADRQAANRVARLHTGGLVTPVTSRQSGATLYAITWEQAR